MNELTLVSPFEETPELEEIRGLTLPEYILEKANNAAADEENHLWMVGYIEFYGS